MTHLRHLVTHDARLHWPLIAAWVAIVLAHPLVAAVPWSEDSLALALLATGLVGARVVIGAVVIATLVQADSPIDDGSFWRTRPIAPSTMAAAKLALTTLVFVVVPLLVVLAVAVTMQVPARHWPATVGGVLLGEVPAVMLAMVVAARTRRPSTALVGLAGVLASVLLVVAIIGQIVASLPASAGRVDPSSNPVWLALWMTAWLPPLAWAVWWGTKARGVLAVGTTVALVGMLGVWLLTVTRSATAPTTEVSGGVTLTRLDARRVAGSRVLVAAVVSHPFRADTVLLMDPMTVVVGSRMTRLPGAVPFPMRLATPSERAFTVADLSEADALALQGQTVRVTGRLFTFTSRRTPEAHMAFVAGARFNGKRIRGSIDRVYRPTVDVPKVADVVVLSLNDAMGLNRVPPRVAAFLRDGRTHARLALTHVARKNDLVTSRVQLPVMAQPFAVHRLSLRAHRNDLSALEQAELALELDIVDANATFVRVDGSLPMPGLATEARP